MKKIIYIALLILFLSNNSFAQDGYTTSLFSFTESSTIADFETDGWTKYQESTTLDICSGTIQRFDSVGTIFNTVSLPAHNKVRLSFKGYSIRTTFRSIDVFIDTILLETIYPDTYTGGQVRSCTLSDSEYHVFERSYELRHIKDTAQITFRYGGESNREFSIYDVKLESKLDTIPAPVQDGELIEILSSFTEASAIADFNTQGWISNGDNTIIDSCTGTVVSLNGEGNSIQNTLTLPPHTKIRLSYSLVSQFDFQSILEVFVDSNLQDTVFPVISNEEYLRTCPIFPAQQQNRSFTFDHTSPTINLQFLLNSNTIPQVIVYDIKVEYLLEQEQEQEQEQELSAQDCFDHLGTLSDGEGSIPMTNACEPFVKNEEQRFKFTTIFLPPYQYNSKCIDIEVWQNETELQKGDGEIDQWSYDEENQHITWNINLHDFVDKYNCEHGENGTILYWICPFSVKLLYDGDIQVEYKAKIQVTLDTQVQDSLVVDSQKSIVEGVCCENQLKIQTELRFCTDISCESFESSPLTVVRSESIFVEHRILNPEFQHYYLKFLEATLGKFIPDIISYDSSQPGRLILEMKSHIAKKNMALQVISQLHKVPITPAVGGSGSRLLQDSANEEAQDLLNNNQYRISGLEQISVIFPEDSQKNTEEKQDNNISVKEETNQEDIPEESDFELFYIMIGACLGFIIVLSLAIGFQLIKTRSMKKKLAKYQETKNIDTQQEQEQQA